MKYHASIADSLELLAREKDSLFVTMLQHGNMCLEYYVPLNVDLQKPHKQDELYIITSGTTKFFRNGEMISCKKGDVLFVPALMEHRFINFSDDFATWVIFYGDEVNLE